MIAATREERSGDWLDKATQSIPARRGLEEHLPYIILYLVTNSFKDSSRSPKI
jgi:hypothetical protein